MSMSAIASTLPLTLAPTIAPANASDLTASSSDALLEDYFGYIPNKPLAIIAVVAYFLVSLPLFWQSFRSRNKLMLVLPFTGLVECAGYIVRLVVIDDPTQGTYVLMAVLIILAPNALAFANYKMLGKIIQSKAVHLRLPSSGTDSQAGAAPARPLKKMSMRIPYLMNEYGEVHGSRLAGFFFLSDVAAILLQGTGASMQGGGEVTLGTDVLLFGLASQLFFFGVFTLLAIYVYRSPIYAESLTSDTFQQAAHAATQDQSPNASSAANSKSNSDGSGSGSSSIGSTPPDYHNAFMGLFSTILLLYVRNIYRVVEFALGYPSYLSSTELFMYFLDTLFIFVAFLLYIWYNFSAFLSKADSQLHRELTVSLSITQSDSANGSEPQSMV